jgi:hypothetical protein
MAVLSERPIARTGRSLRRSPPSYSQPHTPIQTENQIEKSKGRDDDHRFFSFLLSFETTKWTKEAVLTERAQRTEEKDAA